MDNKILKILKKHYGLNDVDLKKLLIRAIEKGYRYVVLNQIVDDYSSWSFEKDVNDVEFSFGVYVFSINNLISTLKIRELIY